MCLTSLFFGFLSFLSLSSPSGASSSSSLPPIRVVKAILVPSGDQTGALAPCLLLVSCHASPPSVSSTQTCGRAAFLPFSVPSSRRETKARRLPSGDQRGRESFLPPVKRII